MNETYLKNIENAIKMLDQVIVELIHDQLKIENELYLEIERLEERIKKLEGARIDGKS